MYASRTSCALVPTGNVAQLPTPLPSVTCALPPWVVVHSIIASSSSRASRPRPRSRCRGPDREGDTSGTLAISNDGAFVAKDPSGERPPGVVVGALPDAPASAQALDVDVMLADRHRERLALDVDHPRKRHLVVHEMYYSYAVMT